jgi:hypothetical protein
MIGRRLVETLHRSLLETLNRLTPLAARSYKDATKATITSRRSAMVEIEAGLPLSLDGVMTIAAGKRARLSVELATRPIIDRAPAEIGGSEAEAYLLTAHFHFNIDGEPYRVSKPYVEGFQDEPGETAISLNPFLYIGIISATRRILMIEAEHSMLASFGPSATGWSELWPVLTELRHHPRPGPRPAAGKPACAERSRRAGDDHEQQATWDCSLRASTGCFKGIPSD